LPEKKDTPSSPVLKSLFTAVKVKEKPEGAKRPVMVDKEYTWKYEETKYTKYLINF